MVIAYEEILKILKHQLVFDLCPMSIVFVCFSKAFLTGEKVNLPYSNICFWFDDNISSPARYLYLLILPDD